MPISSAISAIDFWSNRLNRKASWHFFQRHTHPLLFPSGYDLISGILLPNISKAINARTTCPGPRVRVDISLD